MPELEVVLELLRRNPILGYSLLAAIFLASVSLGSGWSRLDFVAALRPTGLLHITLAVLLAIGLLILSRTLNASLHELPNEPVRWLTELADDDAWPLGGLSRFPLYLVALAYGPSAGLIAAALFAAFGAQATSPGWSEAVLALELVVLGWLAIYPSAFQHRWAGPLNALLAYFLAALTGGLALLQGTTGEATLSALWLQHQASLGGLLLTALLLLLIGPLSYRELFRLSRITPVPRLRRRDDPVMVSPLTTQGGRAREHYLPPALPELKRVRRRRRELEPPPHVDE